MDGKITVNTRFGKYDIVVGNGLDYGKLALEVKKPRRAVIVSDSNVFPLYGEAAAESFRRSGFDTSTFVIKSGEASKTLATVAELMDFLAAQNITRGDMLAALGGGVTGDITGFTAAIYLRGIDYFQLPTTLLAAVDSSVGGKTGVDLASGKNLAGAFYPPAAVFCDTDKFKTLPAQVYADGMAEVIKHGMIADKEMLLSLGELKAAEMCAWNVRIKARVVEEDEFDWGSRRLLNFGHTMGHAVEKLSGYQISHGSAVAIGMTIVTRASERLGLTGSPCLGDLLTALSRYGLPSSSPYSARLLAEAALMDKKRMGSIISIVIPKQTGSAGIYDLPVAELESFIQQGLE